eukprot:TRINITY_DN8552_c0_g2_i1.p1 TRINITY_DN8552_c0_g2~~TRINITY_DN8552_c0_g2_i1.p1  ORF type:complete len:166 (+),score=35.19 TRINITY_DN8552_c0_g2_i1:50-499(+)
MQQKDSSSAFYLVPADHESLVHVESRVEQMISAMPPDKAYTLTFFRSKGTAIPNGTMHVGLYIFDTCDYIEKNPDPNETSVWKLATGVFLRDKNSNDQREIPRDLKENCWKIESSDGSFPRIQRWNYSSYGRFQIRIECFLYVSNHRID